MSLVIWKQMLKPTDVQEIEVPAGARMLCAREQAEQVCVWFRCDPDPTIAKVKRTIAIVGTGHPAPEYQDAAYLGTAVLLHGALVLHVFEKN